jgi:hypothetical protein
VLNKLVEQLQTEPVVVEVGRNIVRMDGASLARSVFPALFSTQLVAELPWLLVDAAEGNLVPLAEIRVASSRPTESEGMFWSANCRDYFSVSDEDTSHIEICRQWGAGSWPPSTREPVTSDVPTLLLAGHFDPETPQAWAQLVSQGLTNSTCIEFASVTTPCPVSAPSVPLKSYTGDPPRLRNIRVTRPSHRGGVSPNRNRASPVREPEAFQSGVMPSRDLGTWWKGPPARGGLEVELRGLNP